MNNAFEVVIGHMAWDWGQSPTLISCQIAGKRQIAGHNQLPATQSLRFPILLIMLSSLSQIKPFFEVDGLRLNQYLKEQSA